MGGGSIKYPEPTAEERTLQAQQAQALAQQAAFAQQQAGLYNLLIPSIMQQSGLTPTYNEQGQITGVTQDPQYAAYRQQAINLGLTQLANQNTMAGLQIPLFQEEL